MRAAGRVRGIVVLLAVAAVLRIVALVQYGVTYDGGFPDAIWYLDSARMLVDTGTFALRGTEPSALMMPGFPALLAVLVVAAPSAFTEYLLIKLAMLALGLLSIFLLYLLGRRIGNARVGLAAAALLALSPAHIYTGNLALTENLFQVAVLLFALLVIRYAQDQAPERFAAALAVFCAGIYVRETMLVLGLAAVAYLLLVRVPRRTLLAHGTVALLVVAAVLAPWWIRNYRVFGEFVPTTTGAGSPFFEGTFQTFHPYGTGSLEEMGRLLEKSPGSELERNRMLAGVARERLAEQWESDPTRLVLRYAVTKPAAAWLLPFYWEEALGMPSWWVVRGNALLASLGLGLLVRAAFVSSARREYAFLLANVLVITGLVSVLLGLSRYVYPFVPFAYVALADGAAELLGRLRARTTPAV